MKLQIVKHIGKIQRDKTIGKSYIYRKYHDAMAKNNFSLLARLKSFRYAYNGVKIAWQEEHNFRVHCFAAAVALLLSYVLRISTYEWLAIIFSIGFVFVCELLNTALENLSDFVCPENNPNIKRIKDIAAAAVMISSLTALLIGLIIFMPKLISVARIYFL
ncbi:MAG: diacylglycerol kinase family protein [Sphingobacterium sp.]|uniref:diacylglycerol kinase family protein n=1 Tax=unclassified Sphingobacterium TaxID=2609468 RepID=UPI002842E689|nr:diacylglycerol kinase family protein [Sphingobacterium sp.]MDR3007476.1 diacylglycerol kinase family protein [Sphingobacterium sp.]